MNEVRERAGAIRLQRAMDEAEQHLAEHKTVAELYIYAWHAQTLILDDWAMGMADATDVSRLNSYLSQLLAQHVARVGSGDAPSDPQPSAGASPPAAG